jgi:hypothetical protein
MTAWGAVAVIFVISKPCGACSVAKLCLPICRRTYLWSPKGGGVMKRNRRGKSTVRNSVRVAGAALAPLGLAAFYGAGPGAEPASAAPSGSLSYAQLEGWWIAAGGPSSVADIAAAITYPESGANPGSIQGGQPYSTTGWGLWQITPGSSVAGDGVDYQLLDPWNNALAAVAKYDANGFKPWTTYNDGAYKSYLQTNVNAQVPTSDPGQYDPTVSGDGVVPSPLPAQGNVSQPGVSGGARAFPTGTAAATAVSIVRTPDGAGYWLLTSQGAVFSYGDAQYYGGANVGGLSGSETAVGMATTSDGKGYWILANDGAVFSYGDAAYDGGANTGDLTNGQTAVSITTDSSGGGYWILSNQGGVFSFGNAGFYGSAYGQSYFANQTAVQLVKAGSSGYWILSKGGSIYSYGSAPYDGNPTGFSGQTAVAMAPANSSDTGYWVLSAAGGIYAEGTAAYDGGANGQTYFAGQSATSLAQSSDFGGYWILGNSGGVYSYGDAPFEGGGI